MSLPGVDLFNISMYSHTVEECQIYSHNKLFTAVAGLCDSKLSHFTERAIFVLIQLDLSVIPLKTKL